MASNTEFSC